MQLRHCARFLSRCPDSDPFSAVQTARDSRNTSDTTLTGFHNLAGTDVRIEHPSFANYSRAVSGAVLTSTLCMLAATCAFCASSFSVKNGCSAPIKEERKRRTLKFASVSDILILSQGYTEVACSISAFGVIN